MPILGIIASQISGHLWAPEGAYDALATITVPSAGAATVSFVGIPTGYKHLQLRWIWQTSVTDRNIIIRFNSDSGSNYAYHWLYGIGSGTPGATAATSQTGAHTGYQYAASGFNSAYFMGGVTDILDYSSTSKNKTLRTLCGVDYNGSGRVQFDSGLWMNSSTAVSSIDLTINGGGNFNQYSQFALFGVK